MLTVTGRVVSVAPRAGGGYGVTLGPGPHVHWFASAEPIQLGTAVTVEAERCARRDIASGTTRGTLTTLVNARCKRMVVGSASDSIDPKWQDRVRASVDLKLFPYQADGAAWMASRLAGNTGSLLEDEPGLGKTIQTIAALTAARTFPACVVCPSSLKLNWAREFGLSVLRPTVYIISSRSGPIPPADVYILNYGLLRYRETDLLRLRLRAIVYDEAQALKSPTPKSTHRAAVATRLAHAIGLCIELTGTPIENRTSEFWRLLHIIDRLEWPDFQSFNERYCLAPSNDDRAAEPAARRVLTGHGRVEYVDELRERFAPMVLRRKKVDVAAQLPPKWHRSVLVELDALDLAKYKSVEADVRAWLFAQGEAGRANMATRATALVKLTHLRQIAAMGKLRQAVPDILRSWFFDRSQRDPLVIFGHHVAVLQRTAEICKRFGLRTVGITSRDSDEARQRAVDVFQGGGADVFLASFGVGGVGLNLQRSSDILMLERDWVPARMMQAEDRCHRILQTKNVVITYLDAADTVDVHLRQVNNAKRIIADEIVDGKRNGETTAVVALGEVLQRFLNGAR